MRTVTDFPRNEPGLVDRFLGTAFDVVYGVYQHIDQLTALNARIDEIPQIAADVVEEAMVPARVEMQEYVDQAEFWANQAEEIVGNVTANHPFNYEAGKEIYDVTVISGDPDTFTVGLVLWVGGAIEYDFTVINSTEFRITSTDYPDGTPMRILVGTKFVTPIQNVYGTLDLYDERITALEEQSGGTDWVGASDVPPTVRANGDALREGDSYFNTVSDLFFSWTGSAWEHDEDILSYTEGQPLKVKRKTQFIIRDVGGVAGTYSVALPATFPVTLTGDWETDELVLLARVDNLIRDDLSDSLDPDKGAALVAFSVRAIPDIYAADGLSDGSLKTTIGKYDGETVLVLHRRFGGVVAGGGHFTWDALSVAADDAWSTISVTGEATGRWIRHYNGPLQAEWFGAEPYVVGQFQDSTIAFNAAAVAAGAGGDWKWSGRHRITGTVNIPRNQKFGSHGKTYFPIIGDYANWQGTHIGGGDELTSALFFDAVSGEAFRCQEGAEPNNFTLYTGFSAAAVGQSVMPAVPLSYYNDISGISHNKFITPKNVSVVGFRYAFNSYSFDALSGNYYSNYNSVEVTRCFCPNRFRDTDVFNINFYDCKFSAISRLFDTTVALRDFSFFGGSIEGWIQGSSVPGLSKLAFFGTYFETFTTVAADSLIATAAGSRLTLSLNGNKIYLSNSTTLLNTIGGTSSCTVKSSGNQYAFGSTDSAPSHTIFALGTVGSINTDGSDTIAVDSVSTVAYASNYTRSNLYTPPSVIFGSATFSPDSRLNGSTQGGIAGNILSAPPSSPLSGVMYWANGGSWDPLTRVGGYAYPVIWRGAWEAA